MQPLSTDKPQPHIPKLSNPVMKEWVGKRLIFGTDPRKQQKLNPRNRKKVMKNTSKKLGAGPCSFSQASIILGLFNE